MGSLATEESRSRSDGGFHISPASQTMQAEIRTGGPVRYELLAPRNWASWLVLACMRCLELLPYTAMLSVGRGIGWLAGTVIGKFQRTARRNLELCMPGL